MTAKPYGTFGVGAVVEPLTTATSNTLLQDADPFLFYATDFWSWVIQNHPGPRLIIEAANAGYSQFAAAISAGQVFPFLPTPDQLRENQFQYPALFVGRTRTETGRFTAGWEHDRGYFDLLYVLPSMTTGQAQIMMPALRAVEATIRQRTTQGYDPNYTPPGGVLGGPVWGNGGTSTIPPVAGVERVGFGDPYRDPAPMSEYGSLELASSNMYLPTLKMHGYAVERDTYVSIGVKFAGGDIDAALQSPDGTVIDDFIQVATQQAPTLVSVSPTTVPHGTPTALTLTGTLFLKGSIPGGIPVLIGGVPATNIVWVNATTVTCNSPVFGGASSQALSIVLTNQDGQSVTLPAALTIT
jgi:hypothetical protein